MFFYDYIILSLDKGALFWRKKAFSKFKTKVLNCSNCLDNISLIKLVESGKGLTGLTIIDLF